MGDQKTPTMNMSSHTEMYGYFLRLSVALVLGCALLSVCLLAMTFGGTLAAWVGGLGLAFGLIVIFITLLSGLSWIPSLIVIAGITALILIL
ncbi:MAG: hypothetical protein K8F25_00690 [Fimbriimonadaceae bacterium]|nr:hypothetical protein [Alphaproteobacteria bacterium]